MRLIFAGTPEFAATALQAIVAAGHQVALVLTQPDRPAGRGMALQPSAVKKVALDHGIEVFQPLTLKDAAAQAKIAAVGAEIMVVAAYGLILPQVVLDLPRHGCINIHGSLLPRWRGAAPIQRAILAGDRETGITIMRMDEGLDTGPMLLRGALPIAPDMTAGLLHDALAELGARLIVVALARLASGDLPATPQPATGVTYAAKIAKDEARLDWSRPACELARAVRGFNPVPGAFFEFGGERLRVLVADPVAGAGTPGTTLDDRLTVACGEAALRLRVVQRAGRAAMDAEAFLRGRPVPAGTRLG